MSPVLDAPTTATDRTTDHAPDLDGTVCVVTGSSRGIGREIALELGRYGAAVTVNFRSSAAEAEAVVAEIDEGTPGEAVALRADVTDREDVARLADEVHEAFGTADVLVNNAGITADSPFEKMSHEAWDAVVRTNLDGTFNVTKAFFEDVRDSDAGRLINVASVVGRRGNYGQANYAAAKSGLFGFTRSLARELAPHGSTANCVAPGYTRTEMVESVRDDVQAKIRADIPLGRFADVDEIAPLVRFLASEDAAYLTGEVLDVNGGLSMR